MDITIREGRLGDAEFIAWVMQEAGRSHLQRGIWDLALPGPDDKRLGYISQLVKTEDHTFCHYKKFLVAEVNAAPAAALTAYIPDMEVREITIKALNNILSGDGWTEKQIGTMMQCFAPLQTCTPEAPDNTWIIDFVATRKELRGCGLVGSLLGAILEKGRNLGCETSQVAIFIGNTSAQRVYEKARFKIVNEKRHPDFEAALKCPGIVLLRRAL
jgi:ribosomal protein S18 acetylase RimI-like enzyme